MKKEIKVFAVAFLICLVGHGMFWAGFFINKTGPLWVVYAIFCVVSIFAVGGLLLSILTD